MDNTVCPNRQKTGMETLLMEIDWFDLCATIVRADAKIKGYPLEGSDVACKICGRGSCTESFHSIEEQEEFETKTGRYAIEDEGDG